MSKDEEKNDGLILQVEGGLSVIRELAKEQIAFVDICHKQNILMMKILIGFLCFLAFSVILGLTIYLTQKPEEDDKDELKKEIQHYKTELNSKIANETSNFYQKYQQDIQKLYMQGKDSNKELIEFILKVKQENEEKVIVLEKEKISLNQTIESLNQKIKELNVLLTKSELEILKIQSDNKNISKEFEVIKKKNENYQKEIKNLKYQLSEKLTPEEKEILNKDLLKDN